MLDPKYFRYEICKTEELLKKRGFKLNISLIQSLEKKRKILQVEIQNLRNEKNKLSQEIALSKTLGIDQNITLSKAQKISTELALKQNTFTKIFVKLTRIYNSIPNIPHVTVPIGQNEEHNIEIRRVNYPRTFDFVPQDHTTIGKNLGMMDFENAAKIAGSRFVVLYSKLAKLQRALINFMLDIHTKEHGYQEVYVPHLANHDSLFGTGQLPKFKGDFFNISGNYNYSLIPSAEVPVTNLVRDLIIPEEKLPIKFVSHTPCYRNEAGSYGKDLHGMIRQHQFEKVELVRIEKPAESYLAHEEITLHAEAIMQLLELPYRVVLLCSGDMGFSAAKTYDIEVWLPSQKKYREISSCSNFETFQARRMKTRYHHTQTGKNYLVHTLNGSGLAVGRTLVAILENHQDKFGHIHLPKVLWNYMDGEKIISIS